MTWNVTLPQDTSPTANQSDLYAAAWFGLVVADPASWMSQCYVELQLYPDFNWSEPNTTVAGDWAGAIVGWQIDPASGIVDTCYYSPLYKNGNSADGYFEMTQGDALTLTLRGWTSDPDGESVGLSDLTSGAVTSQSLRNSTAGIPLDPAYATNAFLNALSWTPGGQLPVSFGFDIGREGNPGGVSDSGFSGCTPGPLRPGPADPSVPCPSYDPVSWVNDTLTPWKIGTPVFFSGSENSTPAQVGFTSSLGGGDRAITALSNGTCTNRLGSAYCSYPWFGYACTGSFFTFGATDFATETDDFGQSNEYPAAPITNLLGIPIYPSVNFSIPKCGAATYTVTLATTGVGAGTIHFLSKTYSSAGAVSGLGVGSYSLQASPPSGAGFSGWVATGSISLGSESSASTSLRVSGDGSVTAQFSLTPPLTTTWINSTTPGSAVEVSNDAYFSNQTSATTVLAGGTIELPPGVYGIQAAPPPGYSFTRWSVSSAASGTIAAVRSPITSLTVLGSSGALGVEAVYSSEAGTVMVNLTGFGDGVVTLDSVSFPYDPSSGVSNGEVGPLMAGSYLAMASPGTGWIFLGWTYSGSGYIVDFNSTTNVSFVPGVATLTATFAAGVTTFNSPGDGGRVAFNGYGPLPNDTDTFVTRGLYSLDALPFGDYAFSHWQVSSTSMLWILKEDYPITHVWVNGSGSVEAVYVSAANVSITFRISPAIGGIIAFNDENITGSSTRNDTLAEGPYLVRALPNVGWQFSNWTWTDPPLVLTSGILEVDGGGGVLTATFVSVEYPVSFVVGSSANITALVGDNVLRPGQTVPLYNATFALEAVLGPNTTFIRWDPTGQISVQNRTSGLSNLTVSGAGTLFAVVDDFVLTGVTASPPNVDLGTRSNFTALVAGANPTSFSWPSLPTGCASRNVNPLRCSPTSAGSFSVVAAAYGPNDIAVRSGPLAFDVGIGPTIASFFLSNSSIDLGMSTTYITSVTGGTAPLTYEYSPLPSGCVSANVSALVCTPTAVWNGTTEVTVTDAVGVAVSENVSLLVAPALSIPSLVSNRSQVTVSISFRLTVDVTGGSEPLSYDYLSLPSSCSSVDGPSLTCTPGMPGNYTIKIDVRDHAGAFVSNSTVVRVNPFPTVSLTASPFDFDLGASVTFSITANGGTPPLTFVYSGLPPGCVSVNQSVLTCQPTAAGVFYANATAKDSLGATAQPSFVSVKVNAAASSPPSLAHSLSTVPWWLIALVVLVIAVIVLVALLHRRRRAPRSVPPSAAGAVPSPPAWSEEGPPPPPSR